MAQVLSRLIPLLWEKEWGPNNGAPVARVAWWHGGPAGPVARLPGWLPGWPGWAGGRKHRFARLVLAMTMARSLTDDWRVGLNVTRLQLLCV